jgi:hypothetical protein
MVCGKRNEELTVKKQSGGSIASPQITIHFLGRGIKSGKPSYLFREKFPWNHYCWAFK